MSIKTEILYPETPNFLRVRIGDNKEPVVVAVKDFSEEDLREVGKRWTEDLVAKAQIRYRAR